MTKLENPWLDMPESSQRRVDTQSNHNLFWIIDLEGKYGFLLHSKNKFNDITNLSNLKGITIVKRNTSISQGELILLLNKNEDWQIFVALCEDLISITHKYKKDEAMISAVEVRLKRWQQLLRQDRNQEMSVERQMGLFTELLCLKDILYPKIGISQSIISWVGADFDKQDFLLDNAIIEVKSYRTTKGPTVHISSLQQLYSDKEPLFLLTYGLTQSENGLSIEDLVNDIDKLLENESTETKDSFDNKLLEYGFIPEIVKTPLYKFISDKNRAYFISDDFPKISPFNVRSQIQNVKYSIDLLQCVDYEIEKENIFTLGNKND